MLQQIGIVALGGALGATLRYVVSEWVSVDSFPYATLSINLVGSFLLGVMAVGLAQNLLSANMALLLGTWCPRCFYNHVYLFCRNGSDV